MSAHLDVVVIGGGQAGARAIQALRRNGHEGTVTLVADEPHHPYERPPLSKEALLGDIADGCKPVLPAAFYRDNGIEMILGVPVDGIDRAGSRVRLADGLSLPYDRLLIATGARLRRLATAPDDHPAVFYLRTMPDAERLSVRLQPGTRLLVVGGGFIGLEIAAAARKRGCAVHLVEAGPALLGRVAPPALAEFVARRHRREGVELSLGVAPMRVSARRDVFDVELGDGRSLEVDAVAVGIGVIPETGLAQAAGLHVDDGIVIDAECRSSDPAIFAAGDVARQYSPITRCVLRQESWQNAQDQGVAAGLGLGGSPQVVTAVPWAWSDQYDLNLQVAGARLPGDEVVVRNLDEDGACAVFLDGDRLRGAMTMNRGRDMTILKRLLLHGAQIDRGAIADPAAALRDVLADAMASAA